uniref:G-protein coupled receptors family 1 profile domain-containing protein n=1 Tax=Electrophorus electricus TaxID=8005 RepID=A0AAY5E7G4_ELEEL
MKLQNLFWYVEHNYSNKIKHFTMSNDSCGEQLLDFTTAEKLIIGVMLAVITALTVIGNMLVVIAVCVVKKLRQPSNYLLVSLAVADLSVAVVVMPFVIVTDLTGGKWLFGEVFCNIFIGMDVMCFRYNFVKLCCLLIYSWHMDCIFLMAKMIVGVWLVSASITLPPFCGWAKNVNAEGVCLISQDFSYTIYSTAVAFYIPMLVMLIMYYKIFKAARKSGAKHRFTGIARAAQPEASPGEGVRMQGLKEAHGAGVAEECVALSRFLSPDRRNMSIFKREQKAATTLGVIVGVFSVCWLPFFLLTTARPFVCGVKCSCVPLWVERTLLWFGYANSLMNPFIYAFFNRDLRSTYHVCVCVCVCVCARVCGCIQRHSPCLSRRPASLKGVGPFTELMSHSDPMLPLLDRLQNGERCA